MKPVLPSEVVGLIDECFPALADHTQVGAGADHTNLAKVVEAMSAIPEACVPAGLSMRYAAAQGMVSTALRAWEGGQRNRFIPPEVSGAQSQNARPWRARILSMRLRRTAQFR